MNTVRPNLLKDREPTTFNGYLRYVPGQDIGAGSTGLPAPSAAENHTPERKVEIFSAELGARVRITYKLTLHRHHKSSHYSWVAHWADMVDDAPTAA